MLVRRSLPMRLIGALVLAASSVACGSSSSPSPSPSPPPSYKDATVVGAGDIGWCGSTAPEATAKLLDAVPGTVLTFGDNAYPDGSAEAFRDCYAPNWGRHKARTRPSPGNHEYYAAGAAPYFAYFGENAGPSGRGYYSFDLEAWHLISLDSAQAVEAGSAQWAWLQSDLAASTKPCTLAYFHVPLVSSGPHGLHPAMIDIWRLLYAAGAEVVLCGHDHLYERFAPMTPDGMVDLERGVRQFIVGTGGATLYDLGPPHPASEAGAKVYGVLELTLRPVGYQWQFRSIAGEGYTDVGFATCH